MPIDDHLAPDRNNFLLVRLLLAASIIFTHAFELAGTPQSEPLRQILGVTASGFGVCGFFALSGFLVAMSYARRPEPLAFLAARALRIIPGYWCNILVTTLWAGLALTTLDPLAFFADPDTLGFVRRNMLAFDPQYSLPGVFAANPYPGAVSGTFWTIRYELALYLALLLVASTGLLRSARAAGLALAGFLTAQAIWWLMLAPALHRTDPVAAIIGKEAAMLSLCFVLGAVCWRFRHRLTPNWLAPALLVALLFGASHLPARSPVFELLLLVLTATSLVFCFGLLTPPGWSRALRRTDLSFGLYLYGFVVQQSLYAVAPTLSPWLMAPATLAITAAIALASWRFVEAPALRLLQPLLARLAARPPAPSA